MMRLLALEAGRQVLRQVRRLWLLAALVGAASPKVGCFLRCTLVIRVWRSTSPRRVCSRWCCWPFCWACSCLLPLVCCRWCPFCSVLLRAKMLLIAVARRVLVRASQEGPLTQALRSLLLQQGQAVAVVWRWRRCMCLGCQWFTLFWGWRQGWSARVWPCGCRPRGC